MSTVISALLEFINAAERNRKYPPNTASARRSALRLFEPELNDEERESLDTFRAHFDQIFQGVSGKNKTMTAESLLTYRNRLNALLSDYEKYGIDPIKMANWNRLVRKVSPKDRAKTLEGEQQLISPETERYKEIDMSRFELPLRAGIKAIILVPSDITKDEVNKIRKYIDFLESISK